MGAGSGADQENELGGGQFRGSEGRKSPSGVQGRNPGRESGGRSPPEADDFSQLKGYLDVTSGILGGMAFLPPPLKSASAPDGSVAEWLACWTQAQKGPASNRSRRCRVTVLGKLFTPIVPLFTKQQNW